MKPSGRKRSIERVVALFGVSLALLPNYYLLRARGKIWMLTVYGKNVRETIAAHLLRQMKEAIDNAKDD